VSIAVRDGDCQLRIAVADVVVPAWIAIVLVEEVLQGDEQIFQLGRREHGPDGADVLPVLSFDPHVFSLAHRRTPIGSYALAPAGTASGPPGFMWEHPLMAEQRKLIRLDPDSEACLPLMIEIIAEEISARLGVRDDRVDDPAWPTNIATLAADALLDSFQVRERTTAEPRTRWD
jgi:hypothetical protein